MKKTFYYYFPEMGDEPGDCRTIREVDAEEAAKAAHERSNDDDFSRDMVVMVSEDEVNWKRFETWAEECIQYSAKEVQK